MHVESTQPAALLGTFASHGFSTSPAGLAVTLRQPAERRTERKQILGDVT